MNYIEDNDSCKMRPEIEHFQAWSVFLSSIDQCSN